MRVVAAALIALSLAFGVAVAEPSGLKAESDALARRLDHVNYELSDRAIQGAQAQRIAHDAQALSARYPHHAEPLVWEALALSTQANALGNLSALPLVNRARDLLEEAERINPRALGDGSIYTNLAILYAQAPGFPISFGDQRRARAYFAKALAIDPDGLDTVFSYGEYLFEQKDYAGAVPVLRHALKCPPAAGREIEDRYQRRGAAILLSRATQKLNVPR